MRSALRSLTTLAIVLALFAAACSDDDAGSTAGGDEPADGSGAETTDSATTTGGAEALDATLTVAASPVSPIAATVTIDSTAPVTAQISATAGDHEVATPVTAALAASHTLPLVGMRQDRTYDLAVTLTGEDGESMVVTDVFTTGTIDDNIPEFDVTVADPARRSPGITIVETNTVRAALPGDFGGNAVVGLDEDDEIVWYYNTDRFNGSVQPMPTGEVAAQNDPFGMSVQAITGETLRRYYPDPTGLEETRVEDGIELIPYHADWVELGAIHHDLQWQPDGTVFALSRTVHEIPVARQQELCPGDEFEWGVISDVIVHMTADGEVVRTWDLWDISSFDTLPGNFLCQSTGLGVSETERDWTHANALWFDESRDAILVSSRHTDQIIALAMTEETGPQTGVRWILGEEGTIPYEGESFHHTHGVKTTADGDVIFYDNGNFRPGTVSGGGTDPNYSRGVRIRVDDASDDPSTWTATEVWDHRMVDPVTSLPIFAPFISDTDELANGNILVTHGGAVIDPTDFLNTHVHIVEIDPEGTEGGDSIGGDIVWELRTGGVTDEDAESTYRSDRWESLYFGPLWAEG